MSRNAFREHIRDNYSPPERAPSPMAQVSTSLSPSIPPPPLSAPPATQQQLLPELKRASSIRPGQVVLPPILVQGLLHRGCKMVLSGGSKSFKSWQLMDLAISLALGLPWWGLQTQRGVVVYLNFELIEGFADERFISIARAKGCELPDDLLIWNLRGYCYDLNILSGVLAARLGAMGQSIAAIIIDPIYKAYGDLDENSASDMAQLMNIVERVAQPLGASIIFGAHFAKGNAASKEAKDRISGSGVLARDPDCLVMMTRHKEDDCYTVSTELRYLPRLPEFVLRWDFPMMRVDESLDPRQLYQPGNGGNESGPTQSEPRPQIFTADDVLACLPRTGAQDSLWRRMVSLRFNRSGQEYYDCKAQLLTSGRVVKRDQKYYHANLNLQHPQ